jgi:hypothetical protein
MTAPPAWSSGEPEPTARPDMPAPDGERVAFCNLLGVAQFAPAAPAASPGAGPSPLYQRFRVGQVLVIVAADGGSAEQVAETARKRLGSPFKVGPTYPAQVAGYPGLGRVVQAKATRYKPAGPPEVQTYAVVGPYSLTLTADEVNAGSVSTVGQVSLYPAAPPVITPIVRIPAADRYDVEERVIIHRDSVKLTAIVSPGRVAKSSEEFAVTIVDGMRSRLPNIAVDNWQPDVFLGGQPCIQGRFLHVGAGLFDARVRSEFWWAGVVGGRGIQVFVSDTKSVVTLDEARPLRDVVVLLPPD